MSARLANEIARISGVSVLFVTWNEDLISLLDASIEVQRSFAKTKLPLPFLYNLSRKNVKEIRSQLLSANADVVIVCQGDIEFGCKGLLAAKDTDALVISYIPMAFSFDEMAAKFSSLRDRLARKWYKLPDAFITINAYQGQLLRRFSDRPIWVVPNPMEETAVARDMANGLGNRCNIAKEKELSLGIIGRVAFRQKNHPAMVRTMRALLDVEPKAICHVIGDGPDLPRLKALVRAKGMDGNFRFHGWVERKDALRLVDTEVDIVAIPSRFEGVPLVLLEAVASGKPFLISPFPWLDEYEVPLTMQADWADEAAVVDKIRRLKSASTCDDLKRIYESFESKHSLASFEATVQEVVLALTEMRKG